MGCDDGSGRCYTRDFLTGQIIVFSEHGSLTPEGAKHVRDFRYFLYTTKKAEESDAGKTHKRAGKNYPK